MSRIVAVVYFAALSLLVIVGGGLMLSRMMEAPDPGGDDRPPWLLIIGVIVPSLSLAVSCGIWRRRRNARRFLFGNMLFVLWLPMTLGAAEGMLRIWVPPWPSQSLHGVAPEVGRSAWGRQLSAEDGSFNSWGQRDRERTLQPAYGTMRIGFIGDSFLEESSEPVSLEMERLLGRNDIEILNLGVSATQPDEYFYRLSKVAVPLGCHHCVVCLFSGNDFVDEPRTLISHYGMTAVAPRPSVATAFGLRAFNHFLTNHRRPVLQAWFASGDLGRREANIYSSIRRADDPSLRHALLNSSPLSAASYENLKMRLSSSEMSSFFAVLREPDAGKFRSYYLTSALWSASVGGGQWAPNPETQALYWAGQMHAVCQTANLGLTFVIIPEAFQVDRRMCDQWAPLTDMRHLTAPCREASERFCISARKSGYDVLDLHSVFAEVPGTYLNLDGHWSRAGVDLAAEAILKHLQSRLPKEPGTDSRSGEKADDVATP